MLLISSDQLSETINEINNKIIRNKNRTNITIFLFKFKDLAKFKSIKVIKIANYLTFDTKKAFNYLR